LFEKKKTLKTFGNILIYNFLFLCCVVDTRNAGKGELCVAIKAAGRDVKLKSSDVESNGIHQVSYQPIIPVPHYVHVKYNNFNVHGSPFMVNVREQNPSTSAELRVVGLGLYQGISNKMSTFIIDSAGKSSHEFDVVITGMQHSAVPAQCYQHKNGMNLIVEFTPPKVGEYFLYLIFLLLILTI